jgi:chromosome partitioning protein
MKVVAIANSKGGTGKTTTAVHLADASAKAGRRTLLIDCDPQGGATRWLIGPDRGSAMVEGIKRGDLSDAPRSVRPRLDLIASGSALAAYAPKMTPHDALRRAIAPLRGSYDLIVLDTPPAINDLMFNALAAVDGVLIPIECSALALAGTAEFEEALEAVRHHLNPKLRILGVLPVRVSRTTDAAAILDVLRDQYGAKLLDPVPEGVVARRVVAAARTVFDVAPKHPIALNYGQVYEMVRKAR